MGGETAKHHVYKRLICASRIFYDRLDEMRSAYIIPNPNPKYLPFQLATATWLVVGVVVEGNLYSLVLSDPKQGYTQTCLGITELVRLVRVGELYSKVTRKRNHMILPSVHWLEDLIEAAQHKRRI